MATGFGGGARLRLIDLDHYPAEEIDTHVRLTLPFGIPGINGTYLVHTPVGSWAATFWDRRVPPLAIEPHLEGYRLETDAEGWVVRVHSGPVIHEAPKRKAVSIEPDRWGRSWKSEAALVFHGRLKASGDEGPAAVAQQILDPCCVCLNRVLDAVTYVGGSANLPSLTRDDFWYVDADFRHGGTSIGYVNVGGLQTFWWRSGRRFDDDVQRHLRELLASEAFLPLHEELIVTATRKLAQGDYRGAVIDAICAVESVLGPILEQGLAAKGASKNKIGNVLGAGGIGLADQIAVLLPAIDPPRALPEDVRARFAQANGKRNRIVHRGEGANAREAESHLGTCRAVVEMLTTDSGLNSAP
jgi:hypothetical protein